MSNEYFTSLTAVNGIPFRNWDDGDFRSFAEKDGRTQKYLVIHSSTDEDLKNGLATFYDQLESADHAVSRADDQPDHGLKSGEIMALMSEFLLRN